MPDEITIVPPSFNSDDFKILEERDEYLYPEIWNSKIDFMILWFDYVANLAIYYQKAIDDAGEELRIELNETLEEVRLLKNEIQEGRDVLVSAIALINMPVASNTDDGKVMVWDKDSKSFVFADLVIKSREGF